MTVLDRDLPTAGLQLSLADTPGRLDRLIAEAHTHVDHAIQLATDRHDLSGIACLFSGGNDSTVLAHLIRDRVTHYVHANTQVGAEPTRQFVRDTASRWNVPLLEGNPRPGHGYEDLVLRRVRPAFRGEHEFIYQGGFPGWPDHNVIFGWIKDRWLRTVRSMLVPSWRTHRVVFINGIRASESAGRMRKTRKGELLPVRREGSVVRVSPLLNWTKLDLNDYRRRFPDTPRNELADHMHMSMECACGASAKPGELDFMAMFVPSLADYLRDLQDRVRATAAREDWDIDPQRLCWGWWNKGGRCLTGACNV